MEIKQCEKANEKNNTYVLKQQKEELMDCVLRERTNYFETEKANRHEENQAVCAYVTFRSFEGKERCLREFDVPFYTKVVEAICCCFLPEKLRAKKMQGRWLNVTTAVEPSLINWHNFGVSSIMKFFRAIVFFAFLALGIMLTFYIVLILERAAGE